MTQAFNNAYYESNTVRIIFDWGEEPRDFDSRFSGIMPNGMAFETASYAKTALYDLTQAADLDRDDTYGVGPEITTPHTFTPAIHSFAVLRHGYACIGRTA